VLGARGDPFDPQSLNRYAYVRNNPVNRIDPSGYVDFTSEWLWICGDSEALCGPANFPSPTSDVEHREASLHSGFEGGRGPGVSVGPAAQPGGSGFVQRDRVREAREFQAEFYARIAAQVESQSGTGVLDAIQAGLDVASMGLDATGVGAAISWAPDVLNAGISLGRGDVAGAGLSTLAAVPFIGAPANAARIVKHHAWPKYLGGATKQELVPLSKSLHDAFHSGLDKVLPRQWGSAYYRNLGSAAYQRALGDLADYTKAFDAKYGTQLYDAMMRNGFSGP
jgi:hypothetical protein